MTAEGAIDRLPIRKRPNAAPIIFQSWRKLLFMHWQLPPELLRPHVPEGLELDTFEGSAWIAITPFIVRKSRPAFFPPLPWLGDFNEVNVRTYVHLDGVPGVWFFSLDADSTLAVAGARAAFCLPYHAAKISVIDRDAEIFYASSRSNPSAPATELEASWRKGAMLGEAAPGSLEFFLVERYCLYATEGGHLFRARIHHPPWQLQSAELMSFRSTMIESQGLPKPSGMPFLHYSEIQDTAIWPLKKVR